MERVLRPLANAVIGIFLLAILCGIFLPVYTDEVGWRFQERAGFDGVDKMFADTCGPNALAVPPPFMWPARLYSSLFNGLFADPFWVRVSGILYALIWVGMAFALMRRATAGATASARSAVRLFCFGLLALGTMPLLMVWSRPEQPVILTIAAALLIATVDWRRPEIPTGQAAAWRRSLGILLLGTIAVSYHVKGVVAVPVFLACLFFACRGTAAHAARLVCGTLLLVVTGWATHYWVYRLQCPQDAVQRAAYAVNNMGAVLTGPDGRFSPVSALPQLLGNISLSGYFALPTPRVEPLSSWLAAGQISAPASSGWRIGLIAAWSLVTLLAAAALVRGGVTMVRARRLDAAPSLALVLFGTAMAWSATQLIRNVYEAGFVLPILALAISLVLPSLPEGGWLARGRNLLAATIGLCALASPVAIAMIYGPSLVRANAQSGYIASQPHSLPVFGYAAVKPAIEAAARQCRIPQGPQARAVMVDDLTYFAFMQTRLPQHQLGVTGVWKGSISDPVAYLKSRGSSGIVVGCHLLPPELRARAKVEGKFCCLGPPNW